MTADAVIVGAGAAGCVLAARLSEDPGTSVLLVEAGPDHAEPAPDDLFAALADAVRWWDLDAVRVAGGAPLPYARGRGIGGSSAVNGLVALRGEPADYDAWAARFGLGGWAWTHVRAAFARAEHTLGVAPAPAFGAVDRAVAASCPELRPAPLTYAAGRRTSVVDRYLDPARSRANLTVRAGAPVERVLLDGRRAVGVTLEDGEVIEAPRVIVSAGAIHSPRLLQRSGVARAGVGANLRDHPAIGIFVELDEDPIGLPIRAVAAIAPDCQILPIDRLGPRVGMVMMALMAVCSTGHVGPTVELNLLADEADAQAFDAGIQRLLAIADGGAWDGVGTPRVPDELREPSTRLSWVHANLGDYVHACGTCRMGHADDDLAVVDERGAVIGYDGLFVVDASIFPDIPRANTNLPTVMAAEHVVQRWRDER